MSKRIERWSDTPAPSVVPGVVMLDPVSGCEVVVSRVEERPGCVVIEYAPSPVGVGYFATPDQLIRTRKVEANVEE